MSHRPFSQFFNYLIAYEIFTPLFFHRFLFVIFPDYPVGSLECLRPTPRPTRNEVGFRGVRREARRFSSLQRSSFRLWSRVKEFLFRRFPTHYGQVCCYDSEGKLMQTSYQPVIKVVEDTPYNPGFPLRAYEFGTSPYMGQFEVVQATFGGI